MQVLSKQRALQNLRARIEHLEKSPDLREFSEISAAEGPFAIPAGLLHEVFVDSTREAGAALGFTLGLVRSLMRAERPALLILQLSRDASVAALPPADRAALEAVR